jgi:NADPH-dependent 2,4-dienoyl-CoA reductase/sulfur reductase-like enzyme
MPETHSQSCDVLVVGGGPAGIAAATRAAERGLKTILVDDNLQLGGQIWRAPAGRPLELSDQATAWIARLRASQATIHLESRVVARVSERQVLVEGKSGAKEISYGDLIIATGARERFLPFPGWTLPNVTGAGGLQALVKGGLPVSGKKILIAGSGPLLLAVAAFLKKRGAVVEGVYEQASRQKILRFLLRLASAPGKGLQGLRYRVSLAGSAYNVGWWPVAAEGPNKLERVVLTNGLRLKEVACDFLACGFGLVPNLELPALLDCDIRNGRVAVDEYLRTSQKNIFAVGETTGIGGLEMSLLEGEIAGMVVSGREAECASLLSRRRKFAGFVAAMEDAFELRPELSRLMTNETIVCRCEDVVWKSLVPQQDWRSAKLHTRVGMGACQGRVCGSALEFLRGWSLESVRPPIYPARVATLANGGDE